MHLKNPPAKIENVAIRNNESPSAVPSTGFLGLNPADMVEQAAKIATLLSKVIKQQKLSTTIGPNEYVRHDGWATLGTLLGILPREKAVHEHPDGSFEAYVELYSIATGQIVGQGSALCGMDEKRWQKAERFARRSMAVTRATGKAYRLGFGWIMALSGFQSTPAEEMSEDYETTAKPVPPKGTPRPVAHKVYDPEDPLFIKWLDDGLAHFNAVKHKEVVIGVLQGKVLPENSDDRVKDLQDAINMAVDLEGQNTPKEK